MAKKKRAPKKASANEQAGAESSGGADDLEAQLFDIVMRHLDRLKAYIPGPVKKAGGTKEHLIQRYAADPLYSIFGLDSPEYVSATLGGGTVTSIHRKLGDIYEDCLKNVFHRRLGISFEQLTYSAQIMSGTTRQARTADAYIQFDQVRDTRQRKAIEGYCDGELRKLTEDPKIELIGVGMEVRHCYQTGDSKRTQADEAMARHFFVSGVLPVMPLFCNQSNPSIIQRYRSVWVIKQGDESYDMVRQLSGFDLYEFMRRHREEFRRPVIEMLRGLTA